MENINLNVSLLRRKVPNLTTAAKSVGLRPATVSNLCTGKSPIARAEVRTLVALASLAECTLDDLIIRGEKIEMIETGIKVLDVFAPLTKGGTVGLLARPGMGQLVILGELLHRLKKEDYQTILLQPDGDYPEIKDLMEDVQLVAHNVDEVFDNLNESKDTLLVADRSYVESGEVFRLQDKVSSESLTIFLLDLKGEAMDEDIPYGPLDTLWQFDADLAARHLYPAVNPMYSTSSILEGGHLDQAHLSLQQRAKKLLRRYRELRSIVAIHGLERLPDHETHTYHRGERLEAYFSQPFYVAEPFTGTKGETVSLQKTLEDIRKIMDGAADELEVDKLKFVGSL